MGNRAPSALCRMPMQSELHSIDDLLTVTVERNASDLHLTAGSPPVIRVTGRLERLPEHAHLNPEQIRTLMYRILSTEQQKVLETRRQVDFSHSIPGLARFRVNAYFQRDSVGAAFRLIPDEIKTLEQLGIPTKLYELADQPRGLVLVTGPTGSGKTTTLYSTLKLLATPEVNVCTIEDPIEMVEPAVNQMQVQHQIELGFADGVRALMRQDPDIIMVGEIRDLETAEMAVQSALTGHLVLSTLHTNDAPSAVTRLLELGVAPYLLNATLNGIMAQRLVRTLCRHCKQKVEFNRQEDHAAWDALVAPWKTNRPAHVYKPVGCLECRMTGFSGRVGIYEVLLFSAEMKALLSGGADLARLREAGFKEGMKPLRISGAAKVAAGLTTLEEVFKVAPPGTGERRKATR